MSKTKKKVQKRVKDAMKRSETVHRNQQKASGVVIDEIHDFLENYPDDVIYLEKPEKGSDEGPKVKCTCEKFEFGPDTNLLRLGMAGKVHAQETGHKFRSHDA